MRFYHYILTGVCLFLAYGPSQAQVSITSDGSAPSSSSILEVKSTDKGIMIPSMRASDRDAISSPAEGLMVYVVDVDPGFYQYNGANWTPYFNESSAKSAISIYLFESQTVSTAAANTMGSFVVPSSLNGTTLTEANLGALIPTSSTTLVISMNVCAYGGTTCASSESYLLTSTANNQFIHTNTKVSPGALSIALSAGDLITFSIRATSGTHTVKVGTATLMIE